MFLLIYQPYIFSNCRSSLATYLLYIAQDEQLLKEGQHVTLVQSGAQPIWREESTHLIQVRKIKIGG